MTSYVIEQILKNKKITEYLASKGHFPKGNEMNGKLRYHCPLHSGDKTPSFIVYLNGEFENYYCYGCKARYHIVHLYRDLEGVSTGEAIRALAGDLDIDLNQEITHAVHEIEADTSVQSQFSPPQLSLIVGRQLYDFLQRVEYDPDMVKSAEKIESIVDGAMESGDMATLEKLYDSLPETLYKAVQLFDEKKEKAEFERAGNS